MTQGLLFRRSSHGDVYAINLAAILRDGQRVWDPSYALSQDPEAWEKANQDPVISGAIDRNLLAVAGTEWGLTPYSDEPADVMLASLLEDLVRRIPKFTQARKDLATAKFRGSSFAWVTGDMARVRIGDDSQVRKWFVPGKLLDIDRRRLHAVSEEVDRKELPYKFRWKFYSAIRKRWEWIDFSNTPMVRRIYADTESRFGYGRGIMDSIYFTTYIRAKVLKDGLQGIQRWAQGLLVASIDPAQAAAPDVSNEQLRDDMKTVLLEMVNDNVLIKSLTDEVEVIQGGGEGYQMVESMLDRIERELVTRIEGTPVSLMDGDGGGSRALGQEHGDREHAQQTFDREDLSEDLDQLVQIIYDRNVPTLASINPKLAQARLPSFAIRHTQAEDPGANAELFEVVLRSGVSISEKEYRERVGIRQPDKDEDVIEPIQATPDSFGGFPGGPELGS